MRSSAWTTPALATAGTGSRSSTRGRGGIGTGDGRPLGAENVVQQEVTGHLRTAIRPVRSKSFVRS